jgi:hypothetical protein
MPKTMATGASRIFISLPTYREPPRRLKAIVNVRYFVSGWTWSGMTHKKMMHHVSISKGDFFVIYLMNGSVESQVDGSLDRSNSVFVKRGAVHRPPCLDFVAVSRRANPLPTLQNDAPPCFLGLSRTMIRTTTMIFLFFPPFSIAVVVVVVVSPPLLRRLCMNTGMRLCKNDVMHSYLSKIVCRRQRLNAAATAGSSGIIFQEHLSQTAAARGERRATNMYHCAKSTRSCAEQNVS